MSDQNLTPVGPISPFFIVADVPRSMTFYEKLGFEVRFATPAKQPFFAILGRDAAQIFVKAIDDTILPLPNPSRHESAPWDAFVFVADPQALASEFTANGVSFRTELADRDDGLRGFEIADVDGYVVYFGTPIREPSGG